MGGHRRRTCSMPRTSRPRLTRTAPSRQPPPGYASARRTWLARAGQAKEMLEQRPRRHQRRGNRAGAGPAARGEGREAAGRESTRSPPRNSDRCQASQQAKASGGGGRAGRPAQADGPGRESLRRPGPDGSAPPRRCSARWPTRTRETSPRATPPTRTAGSCRPRPAATCAPATCRPWPTTARSSWRCCCTTTRSTSARCTRCSRPAGASLDAIGVTRAIGTALFDAGYASEAKLHRRRRGQPAGCRARRRRRPAARPDQAQTVARRLGRHGRHDGHARGQGSLQEAPGHHRARLRAAVRAHGTEPELPRRDGPYRASPVGYHPQPAEMLPQPGNAPRPGPATAQSAA